MFEYALVGYALSVAYINTGNRLSAPVGWLLAI